MTPFLWLVLAIQSDDPRAAIEAALEKTAASSYAYEVSGRFERTGESFPENILTSRIKNYQSARKGPLLLVKGPDGLWKTPEERIGEKTQNPDPDDAAIVRTLQEAEAPHAMLKSLLALCEKAGVPEDREVDGIFCRRTVLPLKADALRSSLESQIEKAVDAGTLAKPDEVQWNSAKGGLRVYVAKKDGVLVKAVDERSVKIAYAGKETTDLKTYKTEMELEFSAWGRAALRLPPEIMDRLKIENK